MDSVLKNNKTPFVLWITGLSGSGKTTMGTAVHQRLKKEYNNLVLLDGDGVRKILGDDLGHTPKDRYKNALRISEMCIFLHQQGINVICCTMSLYKDIHERNRKHIQNYLEVYIEVPLEELIKRDQKQLYSRALKGEIQHVVGIDMLFDVPENCDLVIDNSQKNNLPIKINQIINLIK